jgi:RHS repeat-associated protein
MVARFLIALALSAAVWLQPLLYATTSAGSTHIGHLPAMPPVAAILAPIGAPSAPAAAGSRETTVVSANASGTPGNNGSSQAAIARAGRFVAFYSRANNLVPRDVNSQDDIFVVDQTTHVVDLLSVSAAGVQANAGSYCPTISDDGRFVAFVSFATNLIDGRTLPSGQIYLRDRVARTTTLVSANAAGDPAAQNSTGCRPSISGDGRLVAYASYTSNIVPGANGFQQIHVWDRITGLTTLGSVNAAGVQGDNASVEPSLSANGSRLAFTSYAQNLTPDPPAPLAGQIYVHDLPIGSTVKVSINDAGMPGNYSSDQPAISGDGHVVAFQSYASNLTADAHTATSDVYWRDLSAAHTRRVSLDASGRPVSHGAGLGDSKAPSVSSDGTLVAFDSTSDFGPPNNGVPQIYVKEMTTGAVMQASVSSAGETGVNQAQEPGISGDGSTVVFASNAYNLVSPPVFGLQIYANGPSAAPPGDFGEAFPWARGAAMFAALSRDPVNLGTGSLTVHAQDLGLSGRVLAFDFTRWYNADDPTSGPLGPGWTHTFNWTLADRGATADLRRGDGRVDRFTRNGDGSYADPPNVFDTLVKNGDGTFTLTTTDQVRYDFSTGGRLTRISEPAGNQIALGYTGSNLSAITDTVGRVVSLSYDTQNRLTRLQDPLGRATTYAYDTTGRLVTVTDRIGNGSGPASAHQWRYAYDGDSRHIASITDPDGRVRVTNTYDSRGRVVQQRDGLNQLITIAYSAGQTVITDPRGHATTYSFDSRLRVVSQTDPVAPNTYTLSYTYDSAGDRTSATDRNGQRTDFGYDGHGNVLSKTDPSPDGVAPRPVTSFAYDTKNNLTQITDATGFQTALTYHATTNVLLNVTRQTDATMSAKTTYDYADAANPGLPTRIVAPRGNTGATPDPAFSTSLAYDAQGNLSRRTDADGAVTTFSYDAAGRLTTFVDPDGNAAGGIPAQHTWRVAYDELDRETSRTDPLGNIIRYSYDGAGNRASLADRNGNVTTYAYDANTRLATVRQRPDPLGNPGLTYTTSVTRDQNGNATRITQANGVATDYAFDTLDRLVSVTTHPTPTTPLTTSYVLDGNGQPTSRTTGDGVTVSYTYDRLSRLSAVAGPGIAISYAYDAVGRRTRMSDGTGVTTYQYDGLGRLTQTAAPNGTLGYAYDPDGNRTRLTYPGNQPVNYNYSPGGRLTSLTDWANRTSTYTYQASGLVATLSYPNAVVASYTYDAAQRLTQLSYRRGTVIASERYTLDPEGNRIRLDDLFGTTPEVAGALRYDGLERLTSFERHFVANGASVSNETFNLDAASNIASRTGPAASNSYDGANRQTSDGTRSFTWDGADRLTLRGSDTFSYDPLGRMTSSVVAGTTRSYSYDGDGLLRSRTQGSSTTRFLYDSAITPAPLLLAGSEQLVYGLGPLYRVHPDGSYATFVRDGLGSVRLEVSGTGAISNAFDYTAFGALSASTQEPLLGFAGEFTDPSGLVYLRARWYDPAAGRFVARDQVPGNPMYPASRNLYVYAFDNPALLTDPSGNCPWCVAAAIGAVVGGSASLFGYLAVSGDSRNLRDALVAFGAGAVSGGVCVATAFVACAAATTLASVAQYGLSTGEKTGEGYAVAGAIGLLSAPFVFTPFRAPSGGLSRLIFDATRPGRIAGWEQGPYRSAASSFLRSFFTTIAVGVAEQVLGAEDPTGNPGFGLVAAQK